MDNVKNIRKTLFRVVEPIDRAAGESEETRDLQYKQMDVYEKWVGNGMYVIVFEFCS